MAHPKGVLIERLEKLGLGKPEFQTQGSGPDHEPVFNSEVVVGGAVYGSGQGSTKREAERLAAEQALDELERRQRQAPAAADDELLEDPDDGPFEGPWPIFEEVLAAALEVANERVGSDLEGDSGRVAIRDYTLKLYKELLEDLGEIVEEAPAAEPPGAPRGGR